MTREDGSNGIAAISLVAAMKMMPGKSKGGKPSGDTGLQSKKIATRRISIAGKNSAKPCFIGPTIQGKFKKLNINIKKMITKYLKPIFFILICEFAGIIGSAFTASSIGSWYRTLEKPSFSPPNWIFGPVWTLLYGLMGIAWYLVWQKRKENSFAQKASNIFIIHLFFNAIWSPIFFGAKMPGLALVDILIILAMIVLLIALFFRINKTAAILLLPYLAWVSFATVLNFQIWKLN